MMSPEEYRKLKVLVSPEPLAAHAAAQLQSILKMVYDQQDAIFKKLLLLEIKTESLQERMAAFLELFRPVGKNQKMRASDIIRSLLVEQRERPLSSDPLPPLPQTKFSFNQIADGLNDQVELKPPWVNMGSSEDIRRRLDLLVAKDTKKNLEHTQVLPENQPIPSPLPAVETETETDRQPKKPVKKRLPTPPLPRTHLGPNYTCTWILDTNGIVPVVNGFSRLLRKWKDTSPQQPIKTLIECLIWNKVQPGVERKLSYRYTIAGLLSGHILHDRPRHCAMEPIIAEQMKKEGYPVKKEPEPPIKHYKKTV